ncbi:hypothetical protein BJF93_22975 [Xaviernesmea oryzae]|uniref:Carrier domain-containing protein n=1 Tax=Xaviernesmea oryzae TaxID=464029 RepID=A0A1Q9AU70_9HYPH|nr:hypothetical protein BJF93_22975 [Xaviernesmea oryzae]
MHPLLGFPSIAKSPVGMLLAQSIYRGDELAVCDDTHGLRYRDLVRQSDKLGRLLSSSGMGPGDNVGLFVEASTDMMIGLWGILFAGSAYVPLSTDYPLDRLAYMIKDAGLKVIVTQDRLRSKLSEMILPGVTLISLDDLSAIRDDDIDGPSAPIQNDVDPVYMIYTSGTIGAPKGVNISLASIVNQLSWLESVHGLQAGEVILQKTPISFDAAQWELLAVCCGALVIVGRPGIYRDPPALIQQIRQHRVTILQGVPTLLQALVDHPEFEQCQTLSKIFSGGEALTRKLAARIFEARPNCRLVNLYGPTECTINAASYNVDPLGIEEMREVIPIGRPVLNTFCFVLDSDLREVKTGETGELYIGGAQLATGYHNRKELTAERFIFWNNPAMGGTFRLYRTGDLVERDSSGIMHFHGRADNQVKFRGYRIELDEVRVAIENHDWVKSAGVFVKPHPRTGQPMLAAAIELNPREAQLMDQGNAGAHHQSKKSRLQVRAQLSAAGLRDTVELENHRAIDLPGAQATSAQRALAFSRKTYRFFEGREIAIGDVIGLLSSNEHTGKPADDPVFLDVKVLGHVLRYLGQFSSAERLLPKYTYASPGALYATQFYIEVTSIEGLDDGYYYYHPSLHKLFHIAPPSDANGIPLRLHFVGKVSAIEPVYKNNIREVLEFETGHILGVLDHILPELGFGVGTGHYMEDAIRHLSCGADHVYLAAFDIVPYSERQVDLPVDIYVQAHGDRIHGLPQGQYSYRNNVLTPISRHLIEQRHVIAINQRVYSRASGMVSLVSLSPDHWSAYIDLGRVLQRLQQNRHHIGLMSSGYSSKTGHDLAAALRLRDILSEQGEEALVSYTALFGSVSEAQIYHEGMHEDAVHMEGPAELIRKDLQTSLPDYMVPSKLVLVPSMPLSPSGKVDVKALQELPQFADNDAEREVIAPRNEIEIRLARIWSEELDIEELSIRDDFFDLGGDSLQAVQLVLSINRLLGVELPVQVLFECSTIEALAERLGANEPKQSYSRAVILKKGIGRPIFCWPGLGGYPMSLRHLAAALDTPRPFIGIQAEGVNAGENICDSIQEMSARDAALIRQVQPDGPYSLWGYSFGARVAYETAWHLEQAGQKVAEIILIAPGSPQLATGDPLRKEPDALFLDPSFLTILYSVFAQTIDHSRVAPMLGAVRDKNTFVEFVSAEKPELDVNLIVRITQLVTKIYTPGFGSRLEKRTLSSPVRLFKARGDSTSFVETAAEALRGSVVNVPVAPDHYKILKPGGVEELIHVIHRYSLDEFGTASNAATVGEE